MDLSLKLHFYTYLGYPFASVYGDFLVFLMVLPAALIISLHVLNILRA